uniref:Uncharacterized protein n=1 Tax=Candidatus Kentrum sp. FW TaxID=2126338 RepID=A0A450SBT9_9GAMM|nr:MAG: hypothetical protein BECKFW1821A_GA0114235_10247 [Candidatus Kentron sp. FW]
MGEEQLKFIDYKKPDLDAGDYIFTVTHRHGDPNRSTQFQKTGEIKVRAYSDRVRIMQDGIFARYPPPGERGEYGDTLAHISLKNPTLPWGRSAYKTDSGGNERYEPWLYLMVINDADMERGDAREPKSLWIDELDRGAFIPGHYHESLKNDDMIAEGERIVTTVDIRKSFFGKMLADHKEDIEYLAHIRQRGEFDDKGDNKREKPKPTRELAVLVANRFVQGDVENYPHGLRNYALLISLENYLDDDSGLTECPDDQYIRFIALTHWWFTAIPVRVNFEQRAKAIDADALRLPKARREPEGEGMPFRDRIDAGLTAIGHQFRLGDRSFSWYRGPCIPFTPDATEPLLLDERERCFDGKVHTATDADKLLRYHLEDGMLDISFASAYELGRFLSLRNPDYLRALFHYKQGRARYITLKKEDEDRRRDVIDKGIHIKHLPYARLRPEMQTEYLLGIEKWLKELARFEGIPHWYLLPDPALLPKPALRIFRIDRKWIQSLWLGALSLGGRPRVTYDLFGQIVIRLGEDIPCCGAFLRSDIVWAYPEQVIRIKAIDPNKPDGTLDLKALRNEKKDKYTDYIGEFPSLPLVRRATLAPDLLLFLSTEPFNYLSLSLPVEALHYGADKHMDGDRVRYTKAIRYGSKTIIEKLQIPFADPGAGILDTGALAESIRLGLKDSNEVDNDYKAKLTDFGSARFGRYMIEGEPKVEFTLGGTS